MAKNWAICIGINHYDYNRPLEWGVNDAEKMRDFFQEAKFNKIYLFTDKSPSIADMSRNFPSQPTYTKLSYWLGKRFKKGNKPLTISDNLWFFFSGHGWRHQGQDYLLLSDSNSDPDYIEKTAIPISDVTNHLRESGAGNIIMLIDACRDAAKGGSIELSKEQGIIKISSCQPNELSYEIKPLHHGAFTYALLESLRLQGEGNCATLERLCIRLRSRVKELTWEYQKKTQIPYAAVEPETKYHLLLLPDYITPNDSDLAVLKTEALQAEIEGDLKLAETIWTRLLRFDQDQALQSLYRIRDKLKEKSSTPTISDETEILKQKSVETANPQPEAKHQNINNNLLATEQEKLPPKPDQVVENSRSKEEPNLNKPSGETRRSKRFQLPEISWSELPSISRRQLLKSMGWTGTGIVTITVGKWLLDKTQSSSIVTVNEKGEEIKRERSTAQYISEDLGNDVTLDMVSIPGGSFLRGTDDAEIERLVKKFDWDGFRRERPQKKVTVPAFSMSKYPITQKQWRAIASDTSLKVERDLKPDPSYFTDSYEGQDRLSRPVERVSWQDAMEFCARLSLKTGQNYRLPTEAEWEYACRAGTTTPFHFGETITGDLANYKATYIYADEPKGQYRQQTTPVGYFKVANAFGLYDMHGNVWEWCLDPWHGDYNGAPTDGSVWDEENQQEDYYQDIVKNLKKLLTDDRYHVLRGGSWYFNPSNCRCANRYLNYARDYVTNVGFRVVSGPPRTA